MNWRHGVILEKEITNSGAQMRQFKEAKLRTSPNLAIQKSWRYFIPAIQVRKALWTNWRIFQLHE